MHFIIKLVFWHLRFHNFIVMQRDKGVLKKKTYAAGAQTIHVSGTDFDILDRFLEDNWEYRFLDEAKIV